MRNRLILLIGITLGGGLLGLLGGTTQASHPPVEPPPSFAARPWLQWHIYYIDSKGTRRVDVLDVRTPNDAIKKFAGDHGDTAMITCMASAYYNYCIEREW